MGKLFLSSSYTSGNLKQSNCISNELELQIFIPSQLEYHVAVNHEPQCTIIDHQAKCLGV